MLKYYGSKRVENTITKIKKKKHWHHKCEHEMKLWWEVNEQCCCCTLYINIFPDILVHEVLKNIACNIATIIESPKK